MYPTLALLTAAFASSGAPTADSGQDENRFDYRTELKPAEVIAIDGRRVEDGSPFSLRVENSGRVTGRVAGAAVSFWVSAAAHRRLLTRLAA